MRHAILVQWPMASAACNRAGSIGGRFRFSGVRSILASPVPPFFPLPFGPPFSPAVLRPPRVSNSQAAVPHRTENPCMVEEARRDQRHHRITPTGSVSAPTKPNHAIFFVSSVANNLRFFEPRPAIRIGEAESRIAPTNWRVLADFELQSPEGSSLPTNLGLIVDLPTGSSRRASHRKLPLATRFIFPNVNCGQFSTSEFDQRR
ncbi:uncharacterized protein CLUP02_13900 [Colletotrichum lupini]|uniref:Uncharacterized protein n=1 Tax=Colletotrichum lupini TaxID=145971 RepID=A0A9Q8T3C8_9PEZI|nr:uncharacterized protein CLUP02_13900 [Colletotrichum lupini]UQC88377.1 hypothetical protein CLUP02_13900 [Colletotrichum lupini]